MRSNLQQMFPNDRCTFMDTETMTFSALVADYWSSDDILTILVSIVKVMPTQFVRLGVRSSDQAWWIRNRCMSFRPLNNLNRNAVTDHQAVHMATGDGGTVAGPQSYPRTPAATAVARSPRPELGGSPPWLRVVHETGVRIEDARVAPKEQEQEERNDLELEVNRRKQEAAAMDAEVATDVGIKHHATCSQPETARLTGAAVRSSGSTAAAVAARARTAVQEGDGGSQVRIGQRSMKMTTLKC